mmetsp:Transcript_7240/g.14958  ORF Transcript_7240/g.14958 Transcript_7240/m.14958 type:complete len:86 (+) Transcript_7240:2-259(+)
MDKLRQAHGLAAPMPPYALLADGGGGNSDLQNQYMSELGSGTWLHGMTANEMPAVQNQMAVTDSWLQQAAGGLTNVSLASALDQG